MSLLPNTDLVNTELSGKQPSLPTVYNSKQHFNLKNHILAFALLILKDLQITSLWLKFILKCDLFTCTWISGAEMVTGWL